MRAYLLQCNRRFALQHIALSEGAVYVQLEIVLGQLGLYILCQACCVWNVREMA
jgi:hypothetical protein